MIRALALACLAVPLVARTAAADSHKLLVLQPEGRADAATRAKIDAAIVKLASTSDAETTSGELTFSDAATAVGCRPETAACKDEVLSMLAVDEIVISNVTPKPGGLEIAVHRIGKGGTARDATMLLATGTPADKLDGIAPLFIDKPPPPARPAPAPPPPAAITAVPPAAESPPPTTTLGHEPAPSPIVTPPADHPAPSSPDGSSNHALELAGIGGGAGIAVVGLIFWGAANGTQGDINNAPTATQQDLTNLRNLESRGDTYATLGNLFVITGIAVAGVSTYFYIRDRHRDSAPLALTPTVLDHGAGLVLTIGGSP